MTLAAAPQGERLDEPALRGLEADGWPVLRTLPADLELYDARWLLDRVLQLSYSDGLSTLSLFLQRGETPPLRGGTVRQVAGGQVWEASGEPERVVWAARGLTWTLISDTAPSVVDQVLSVLPHTRQRVTQEGLVPRLWRGLDRVGAWLNPFR
jgi:sigma-E factor negative regulatory protein RseB